MTRRAAAAILATALALSAARTDAADPADPAAGRQLICQTIEDAAAANGLPSGYLARLLWTESGFRSSATSPAGAEGVAQFMPQTAAERGLADPRDPRQAIHHAARLLVELERHFGNLGLAAAAYNAGAARVEKWLRGVSGLPFETRLYVLAITGRRVEDWAAIRGSLTIEAGAYPLPGLDCLNVGAGVVRNRPPSEAPARVWQVRLDSHLATAIAVFTAVSHGEAPAAPAPRRRPPWPGSRSAAESLCETIRAQGATCAVFGR